MKHLYIVAVAVGALLAIAPATRADVLLDQSDYNLGGQTFANSIEWGVGEGQFGWGPLRYSSVNDLTVTETTIITRITGYYKIPSTTYPIVNPDWGPSITSGWLVLKPKTGALPTANSTEDQGFPAAMSATLVGDHYEVVADGMYATLAPGSYWVGITPDAGGSIVAQTMNQQLSSYTLIGDATATRDYNNIWAFFWSNYRPGLDAAIKVEGGPLHAPAVAVNPESPTFTMAPGVTNTFPLSVANVGAYPVEPLVWSVIDVTGSWLAAAPWNGTAGAAEHDIITLTINTSGMPLGTYNGSVTIQCNDAGRPSVVVPVTLVVGADCNGNGIADSVDIHDGTVGDVNGNGVPDVCEWLAAADLPASGARLREPAPNPFNPRTVIGFDLARTTNVALSVHDLTGRHVRTLVQGVLDAGSHEAAWDGRDDAGLPVPSGVYLCRLVAGSFVEARRMTLLK